MLIALTDPTELQSSETTSDELDLDFDTLPVRASYDIFFLYTGLHVENLMNILFELVTELPVLLK